MTTRQDLFSLARHTRDSASLFVKDIGNGLLVVSHNTLALVGLVDDRRGLPVRLRLVVQLLTGVALALQAGWPLPLALPARVMFALPAPSTAHNAHFKRGSMWQRT